MHKKYDKHAEIEAIADKAHRGEDVSAYFSGPPVAKQRVNIDFPLGLLRKIDEDCRQIGITRQAWVKIACDERLRQVQTTRRGKVKAS